MHAALGYGDCGATDDEDNGEEMSDLSSVCSCDDLPHGRFHAGVATAAAEAPKQCLNANANAATDAPKQCLNDTTATSKKATTNARMQSEIPSPPLCPAEAIDVQHCLACNK